LSWGNSRHSSSNRVSGSVSTSFNFDIDVSLKFGSFGHPLAPSKTLPPISLAPAFDLGSRVFLSLLASSSSALAPAGFAFQAPVAPRPSLLFSLRRFSCSASSLQFQLRSATSTSDFLPAFIKQGLGLATALPHLPRRPKLCVAVFVFAVLSTPSLGWVCGQVFLRTVLADPITHSPISHSHGCALGSYRGRTLGPILIDGYSGSQFQVGTTM